MHLNKENFRKVVLIKKFEMKKSNPLATLDPLATWTVVLRQYLRLHLLDFWLADYQTDSLYAIERIASDPKKLSTYSWQWC